MFRASALVTISATSGSN